MSATALKEWLKDVSCKSEVISDIEIDVHEYLVQNTVADPDRTVQPLFDLSQYSGLNKPLRITAWIKRFIHNTQSKERHSGELCIEEI